MAKCLVSGCRGTQKIDGICKYHHKAGFRHKREPMEFIPLPSKKRSMKSSDLGRVARSFPKDSDSTMQWKKELYQNRATYAVEVALDKPTTKNRSRAFQAVKEFCETL